MRDKTPLSDEPDDGRLRWDLGTFLLLAVIVVVIFWITAEVWMPHWGGH